MPAAVADDLPTRCAAMLLLAPAETAIVDTTAARLHGLWLPDGPDTIQLATHTADRLPRGMTRPRRSELQTHRRRIPPGDLMLVRGLPVTTLVPRADLAGSGYLPVAARPGCRG